MTRAEVRASRHPIGLAVLFLTEMWERFSYYGMRSMLVYFMTSHLLFKQETASNIYGTYTGLVYFTGIFGGWLADCYFGQRRTVVLGGALMAVGQFVLAYAASVTQDPAVAATGTWSFSLTEILFITGLALLVFGSGFFKPNISTQVKSLYPPNDPRVDSAFSIFYVGINAGALIAPLICGTLGELYGWKYGFLAAGLGIVLGLIIYLFGQRFLEEDRVTQRKHQTAQKDLQRKSWRELFSFNRKEGAAIVAIVILAAFNVVNWAVYEQQGNVMAVWFNECTDRHIFNWLASIFPHYDPQSWMGKLIADGMPATWFQAVNPFFILTLTPVVIWFWRWQNKRQQEPTTICKLGLGCIMFGLSYVFMFFACHEREVYGLASLWWPILSTFVLTVGELYLSPVGLSFVSKTAPPRMISTLMGIWLLSSFGGNWLCGYIGAYWKRLGDYNFFALMVILPVLAGVGIFIMRQFLERTSMLAQEEQK